MNSFSYTVGEGPLRLHLWVWSAGLHQSVCCAEPHEHSVGVSDYCCQRPGLLSFANGASLLFLTPCSSTVSIVELYAGCMYSRTRSGLSSAHRNIHLQSIDITLRFIYSLV